MSERGDETPRPVEIAGVRELGPLRFVDARHNVDITSVPSELSARSGGHPVSVLIGNVSAERAYEAVGFRMVDEKRHPEFEREFGCPGIRRMIRPCE